MPAKTVYTPRDEAIPFGFSTLPSHGATAVQYVNGGFGNFTDHLRASACVLPLTRKQFLALDTDGQKAAKDAPAVVLAKFDPPRRGGECIEYVTGLGLDVDEAHVELPQLLAALTGTRAVVHESLRSTPEARRWRVFIPFARPATVEEHGAAFAHWSRVVPGVALNVKDAPRLWYVPSRFKGEPERLIEVTEGQPFDPQAITPPASPAEASRNALHRHIAPPADAPAAEGERNGQLSRYAASVVRQCATQDELLAMLTGKNAEYLPPLPDKEVRSMARSKWRLREKFGWVPKVEAKVDDDNDAVGDDLNQLRAAEVGEVPWVVQDVLTYGAHLLVGRPKGGKSWITMDMAFAVATCGTFLGRQARRCGVLWIASEDSKASLGRRLKMRDEAVPEGGVIVMARERLKAERAKWETDTTFDQWLREFLIEHPGIGLVIMDTQSTVEAIWQFGDDAPQKRVRSAVEEAYNRSRLYEDIAQDTETCIVLVHHAGKLKNMRNGIVDYHELVNLPATVVAGATASLVLADPPDKNMHDEDDKRRIFAMRGRNIIKEVPLLIELKDARARLLGEFFQIVQSDTQAEMLEALEALLDEREPDEKGERWVTQKEIAAATGKHRRTIEDMFKALKKDPARLLWRGRRIEVRQSKGVRLVEK